MRNLTVLRFLLLALLWLSPLQPGPAHAETTTDTETSLVLVQQWTRTLDLVEQELERVDTTAASARKFLDVTERIREEAIEIRDVARKNARSVGRLLEALGPPPELSEAEEIASRRQELNDQLTALQARVAAASLAIARADELDRLVGTLSQKKRFEALFHIYPLPWAPETWIRGGREFLSVINEIARSPVIWWQDPRLAERRAAVPLRVSVLLLIAVALGWFLRRWLLRRYGRDPAVSEPDYTRRLITAMASAGARGVVPALIFAGLFFLSWTRDDPDLGLFPALLTIFFIVGVFFSLAWALPQALLSPDMPQWRLLPVSPENAVTLGHRFKLLAALFSVSIFMFGAYSEIGVTDTFYSLSSLLLHALPALVLIDMSRGRRWTSTSTSAAEGDTEPGEPEPEKQSGFWTFIRRLVMSLATATILASFIGYADLGDFLLRGLLLSAIAVGGIFILRGLGREAIGVALQSNFMRYELQFRQLARSRLNFWLCILLDAALSVAGVLMVAFIWLSPFGEFWTEARALLSGVTIGGVTISFTAILAGVAIFAAVLIVTRISQRFLRTKVLPETGFDSGVQNSITAGLGYVGFILAAMIGISTLGIDLSNIALIAGALSVGIGFGLQTVVSNFVSGIILLIERPIKVGDWVVIGATEGTVKKITVRSTELQTFQRASVIIPNSDLIANSVTNWTHKDLYGRIEVPVGVAYGSDVEKVRRILMECAERHENVLTSPEPRVLFMNFGNSSLDFELRCFTNNVNNRLTISSDLRYEIDRRFREEGVEIPFPQRVVHMAEKNTGLPPADPSELPPEGEGAS